MPFIDRFMLFIRWILRLAVVIRRRKISSISQSPRIYRMRSCVSDWCLMVDKEKAFFFNGRLTMVNDRTGYPLPPRYPMSHCLSGYAQAGRPDRQRDGADSKSLVPKWLWTLILDVRVLPFVNPKWILSDDRSPSKKHELKWWGHSRNPLSNLA